MFMRVITRWQRCESIDAAGQGTKGTVTQMGMLSRFEMQDGRGTALQIDHRAGHTASKPKRPRS